MKKRSLLDFVEGYKDSNLNNNVQIKDNYKIENNFQQVLRPPDISYSSLNSLYLESTTSNISTTKKDLKPYTSSLLVDIVRPIHFSEILGHVEAKKLVYHYLMFPEKRLKPALLISGPTGCGKTLLASLAIKEANYEIWNDSILDMSKDSNDFRIEEAIQQLSQKKSLNGKPWCALIECVEGFATDEKTCILKAAKTCKIPVILTCDDANEPSNKVFREACIHVRMFQNDTNTILRILFKAGEVYGLKLSPETASNILINSNQNVRLALNTLQLLATTKKTAKKGSQLSSADEFFNLFIACSKLCSATPLAYEKSLVISSGDSEMFVSLLHQNCLASTSFSSNTSFNLSKLMDSFSDSDLLMKHFFIEEGTTICSLASKIILSVPKPEKQSYFPSYYSIISSKKSRKDRISMASGILCETVLGEERPLYSSSNNLKQSKKSVKSEKSVSFVRDIFPESKLCLLSQIRPSGLNALDNLSVLKSKVNGRSDYKILKSEGLYVNGDPQANIFIQKGIFK